jgi:LysM repeat protein
VVACTTTVLTPKFTPTDLPPLTLTVRVNSAQSPPGVALIPQVATLSAAPISTPAVYIIQDGDTLVEIGQNFGIAPSILQTANPDTSLFPGQQLRIPQPIPTLYPLPVVVLPPDCHTTQPAAVLCLGQVSNTLDHAVGRVALEITLFDADSVALDSQVVSVSQYVLPAGESAPYRALFQLGDFSAAHTVRVALVSAVAADRPRSGLRLTELGTATRRGYYTLRLEVANDRRQTVSGARVIVTVLTGSGQVAGFRVAELAALDAGETRSVQIEVALAGDPTRPLSHVVSVEVVN